MQFHYEPALRDYMNRKNHRTIVVELVEINNSDFEITELNVRFISPRQRHWFVDQKKYRPIPTDCGEVLLPAFPLTMEEPVTFGLRSFLWFHFLTYKGIKV